MGLGNSSGTKKTIVMAIIIIVLVLAIIGLIGLNTFR